MGEVRFEQKARIASKITPTKNPDPRGETPSFWKVPAGAGRGEGREARGDIWARGAAAGWSESEESVEVSVKEKSVCGGLGRSLGSLWSQQPMENESGEVKELRGERVWWFVGACSLWRVRAS